MTDVMAERRLVKSRPELWAEVSEVERLAEHLGELGEIRITKVEPESTVAWEGEQISGTVELEQSGWGTKVTLSATVPEPEQIAPPIEPEPAPGPIAPPDDPEPEPGPILPPDEDPDPIEIPTSTGDEPDPAAEDARPGFWARLLRRRTAAVADEPVAVAVPEPEAVATVEPQPAVAEPEPEPVEPEPTDPEAERVRAILDGTLDALGQAHHRPFSRG
jgi:hypothetical protein